MEVYNYSTKAWQTVTTNTTSSNCSTADCTLSGVVTAAGTQSYYEQIGTDFYLYVRVWQYENSSAETLLTDYFNVGFENTGTQLRGGARFLNTVKSGFDL
jgi:hypothetical protein